MIEDIRWVWHDVRKGRPPVGAIRIDDLLYQVLQVRIQGEWCTVPHCGVQLPNLPNPSTEG